MKHDVLCLSLLGAAAACAADASNGQEAELVSSAPIPTETAGISESAALAALPSAPTAVATPSGNTCLMFYHCGCNVGCSKVDVRRDQLRDGLEVTIVSGIHAGSRVFVAASKDKAGKEVFSLTHHQPGRGMPCALPAARHLMAYACLAKNSGELQAHACDSGCDETK